MSKKQILGVAGIIAAVLSVLLVIGGLEATTGPQIVSAPMNPAFANYLAALGAGRAASSTPEGHPLGEIPPPFELPKELTPATTRVLLDRHPASFDLRALGGLTAIRDQGYCGSCWAFASFSSLESFFKYKKGLLKDFSEQHLNKYHLWDVPECQGGNHLMSTAYLARWSGPVAESALPYPYAPAAASTPVAQHVQNIWWLPERSGYTANDTVKSAVQSGGAVHVSVYWDNAYYNSANKSFYNRDISGSTNHAVAVVGWNDGFPKTKFNSPLPPGNGAFIVRNSWGTGWGEGGYFYLSYYDKSLRLRAQFSDAGSANNYRQQYSYDPLGCVDWLGFSGKNYAWAANIFTASSRAPKIKAVSFYTPAPGCPYQVWVYSSVTAGKPQSGTLVKTLTGTMSRGGYHTVAFGSTPALVAAGKKFSVVVKVTVPSQYGFPYPIGIESRISGYTGGATASPGQSYTSANGTAWTDIGASAKKANACIKAFGGL